MQFPDCLGLRSVYIIYSHTDMQDQSAAVWINVTFDLADRWKGREKERYKIQPKKKGRRKRKNKAKNKRKEKRNINK